MKILPKTCRVFQNESETLTLCFYSLWSSMILDICWYCLVFCISFIFLRFVKTKKNCIKIIQAAATNKKLFLRSPFQLCKIDYCEQKAFIQ